MKQNLFTQLLFFLCISTLLPLGISSSVYAANKVAKVIIMRGEVKEIAPNGDMRP